jgi:CheY-like chemotaxis protein
MSRILVVDDYPDTARTFELLLSSLGHEVRACTEGSEALRVAARFLPEAALIDIQMPGTDGHEVARGIRALPGLERALLIAMTGLQPGARRRAPEGDFDVFLLKPVDPAELDRTVRSCVEAGPRARRGFDWCLVVDDDPAVRDLMAAYLRDGPPALEAGSCEGAEAALRSAPEGAGCALVDLQMPGPDGLATITLLKRLRPGLPCALVTGSGIAEEDALAGGASALLRKPFTRAELLACLDSLAARA